MLVLAGVAMLCGVLAAKYSAFASQGFGANLRQCLFDKVQEFSFADIDRFSPPPSITRNDQRCQCHDHGCWPWVCGCWYGLQ